MSILSSIDTLQADTALIARWKSDVAFQYDRELLAPEVNFWEWLMKQLMDGLEGFGGIQVNEVWLERTFVVLAFLLILFIGGWVYRNHLGLFIRSHKEKLLYEVEEDTIYGVDFSAKIQQAVAASQFREAVCLLYLQTLKLLTDARKIDWQLYKTPTQYVQEYHLPAFRQLTNDFLRVRYGHFEATEMLFRQLQSLQALIRTEIEKQKGGEE